MHTFGTCFIHVATGEYPVTIETISAGIGVDEYDLRMEQVTAAGYAVVAHSEPPHCTFVERIVEDVPVRHDHDGMIEYHQTWKVVPRFEDSVLLDGTIQTGAEQYEAAIVQLRQSVKDRIAEKRYDTEISGFLFGDVVIKTDRESQATIGSAYARADRALRIGETGIYVHWKGSDGWTVLVPEQLIAIGDAVFSHVQECFRMEKVHSDAVDAIPSSDYQSILDYDIHTGWPSAV